MHVSVNGVDAGACLILSFSPTLILVVTFKVH